MDMDVVILCGGRGTRLSEKTDTVPKPLVEIGDMPILWHIMKYYSVYNFKRFILTLGYKGNLIKEWFLRSYRIANSFELELSNPVLPPFPEDWRILFLNTGLESGTAYRVKQCKNCLSGQQFMLAYGDCIADVDLNKLLSFHNEMKKKNDILVTLTVHRPNSRFGIIKEEGEIATSFIEKPRVDDWVGVGFMVCETGIFDYSFPESPSAMFEAGYLHRLADKGKLAVFKHEGFFSPMDTYKDYVELNNIWNQGNARWKNW
jgi:glucose-1-phosphate cytidylyltransferase